MRLYISILAALILVGTACTEQKKMENKHQLFVGTYTDGDSKGIYKLSFDSETGQFSEPSLAAELKNPSFLQISTDKTQLYAIHETADFDTAGGGVSAFKLADGMLELQNSQGSGGAHPCHISLSGDGLVAVSNYTGGNLSIHQLNEDGSLASGAQVIDHKVLDTTKTAHTHMAQFSGGKLFVSDLGLDAVKIYEPGESGYVSAEQASLNLPDGAGPRHFTFGKEGILYVINELNSTITVFEQGNDGNYAAIQTEGTLDSGYQGGNSCADIHLSADGKFLYGSNRGENSIVIFSVDGSTGKLTLVGRESVHGDWPRNFSLDPSGKFLLVANQKSNNISVFKRDMEQGTLEFVGETEMPSPVCLAFLD